MSGVRRPFNGSVRWSLSPGSACFLFGGEAESGGGVDLLQQGGWAAVKFIPGPATNEAIGPGKGKSSPVG